MSDSATSASSSSEYIGKQASEPGRRDHPREPQPSYDHDDSDECGGAKGALQPLLVENGLQNDESIPAAGSRRLTSTAFSSLSIARSRKNVEKDTQRLFRCLVTMTALTFVLLLVGLIVKIIANRHASAPYEPPHGEGIIDRMATWSEPTVLPQDAWPSGNNPLFSSDAVFSLPAGEEMLFLHATGTGAVGRVEIHHGDVLSAEEWKTLNEGIEKDRVLIKVETIFTDVNLRDRAVVAQMRRGGTQHGVGIYAEAITKLKSRTILQFRITVYFPQAFQRSQEGLAPDGTSFLNHFEMKLTSMRVSFLFDLEKASKGTTFGWLEIYQMSEGCDIRGQLKATRKIDFALVNGHIRDIASAESHFHAPNINIVSANGATSVTLINATETVGIYSQSGNIDISHRCIGKHIEIKGRHGGIHGLFVPMESLRIKSSHGRVNAAVDLGYGIFDSGATLPLHTRNVAIETDEGFLKVDYYNHLPSVRLLSSIHGQSGAVIVRHDSGFEGNFDLSTTGDALNVWGTRRAVALQRAAKIRKVGRSKVFSIDKDLRQVSGVKRVQGHTYFAGHQWPLKVQEAAFAFSHSIMSMERGRLDVSFP